MPVQTMSRSQRRAALIAGAMYLYTIVGSFLYLGFLRPKLIVLGDLDATANSIASSPLLFRAGTTHELLMAICVLPLAWALYSILKVTSERLALLALCWRVAEAILWVLTGLVTLAAAHVVSGAHTAALGPEQQRALLGMLLGANTAAMDVVILLTGLGSIVFYWLFFESRYVPRVLAAWGLATYATMIVYSCAKLLVPSLASLDMIVYTPGAAFETVIGVWLLLAGLTRDPAPSAGPRPDAVEGEPCSAQPAHG